MTTQILSLGTLKNFVRFDDAVDTPLKLTNAVAGQILSVLPAGEVAEFQASGTGGLGLVGGPGASTDNALARWDTASGDLIQNSGVIVDDSDNMTGVASLNVVGASTFNSGANAVDFSVRTQGVADAFKITDSDDTATFLVSLKIGTGTDIFHINPSIGSVGMGLSPPNSDRFQLRGKTIELQSSGGTNKVSLSVSGSANGTLKIKGDEDGSTNKAAIVLQTGSAGEILVFQAEDVGGVQADHLQIFPQAQTGEGVYFFEDSQSSQPNVPEVRIYGYGTGGSENYGSFKITDDAASEFAIGFDGDDDVLVLGAAATFNVPVTMASDDITFPSNGTGIKDGTANFILQYVNAADTNLSTFSSANSRLNLRANGNILFYVDENLDSATRGHLFYNQNVLRVNFNLTQFHFNVGAGDTNFRIDTQLQTQAFFIDSGLETATFNVPLHIDSLFASVVTKTAAYTATTSDHTILCNATSGAIVITLPPASSATGLILHVKKIDSSVNSVTVDGNSSEEIDGSTTQVITNRYDSIMMTCDGTEWHIV